MVGSGPKHIDDRTRVIRCANFSGMSVKDSRTVTVNAPLADVLAKIQDVANATSWSPGLIESEVIETDDQGLPKRAKLVQDQKITKDEFQLDYVQMDNGMSWSLVEPTKVQKEQTGSWTLVDKGGKTEATLELEIDVTIPMPGFMKKKTLKGLLKDMTNALADQF